MLSPRERAVFFGIPAATLVLSYAGICWKVGALWPGQALVHESGNKTLLQTIFWLEHGVRELAIDALLGAGVAGALLSFWPARAPVSRLLRRQIMMWTGGFTLAFVAFVVIGAALSSGPLVVLQELTHSHTRLGGPVVYGSHWHTHSLERIALMLLALTVAAAHVVLTRRDPTVRRAAGVRVYRWAIGIFLVATLALLPTLDTFVDSVHIGHQARELFTHSLVTLLASFGAGLLVLRYLTGEHVGASRRASLSRIPKSAWLATLGVALVGVYLTVGFFLTASYGRGQSTSMVSLVLVHFYEHLLTFISTPVWTAFLVAWFAPKLEGEHEG
jgi:hypothetical protein